MAAYLIVCLFPAAQNAQQVNEQVDEIQVKLKRGENGSLGSHLRNLAIVFIIGLDFLCIIRGKNQEQENPKLPTLLQESLNCLGQLWI